MINTNKSTEDKDSAGMLFMSKAGKSKNTPPKVVDPKKKKAQIKKKSK